MGGKEEVGCSPTLFARSGRHRLQESDAFSVLVIRPLAKVKHLPGNKFPFLIAQVGSNRLMTVFLVRFNGVLLLARDSSPWRFKYFCKRFIS